MEAVPVKFVPRGYGETLSPRRVVGRAAGRLPGAGRLRRLRHLGGVSERALHLRPVSLAVLLAGDLRRLAHTPGSAPSRRGGRRCCRSRRRSSSCRSRASSASPATTTAAPTTRRSGPTRRRARWASRAARATAASAGSRWCCQNVHRYFAYVAVLFLFVLTYDVWLALWFPTADGGKEFGIGLGTIILAVNVVLLASLHARLPLDAAPRRAARKDEISKSPGAAGLLQLLERAQLQASALRLLQPVLGGVRRRLRPALLDGDLVRL